MSEMVSTSMTGASGDLISRQAAIDALNKKRIETMKKGQDVNLIWECLDIVAQVPSAQPQYEEFTPEEAASAIGMGNMMSAWYWLDAMIQLKQMGYVICRKR